MFDELSKALAWLNQITTTVRIDNQPATGGVVIMFERNVASVVWTHRREFLPGVEQRNFADVMLEAINHGKAAFEKRFPNEK